MEVCINNNLSFLPLFISADNWIASGTIGSTACHATYYHKGRDISFGVEFESNFRAQETAVGLGYQVDIPQANCTFKGKI